MNLSDAEKKAAALIERARRAGADAADVLYFGQASTGVEARLGALEDVSRSEDEGIGLRFFPGHRSASVPYSDLAARFRDS
jgi:PmbA protein